jgi:hypothetical protein
MVYRRFACMNFKYFFPAFDIGQRHDNLPVKPARPQKRGIKNIRTVGRGNENHAFIGFKSVHFHK